MNLKHRCRNKGDRFSIDDFMHCICLFFTSSNQIDVFCTYNGLDSHRNAFFRDIFSPSKIFSNKLFRLIR